jgi:hypothetical protein
MKFRYGIQVFLIKIMSLIILHANILIIVLFYFSVNLL